MTFALDVPVATVSTTQLRAAEGHVARVERVIARLRAIYGFSDAEAVLFMQSLPPETPEPAQESSHVG